jgi:hypothetical protein
MASTAEPAAARGKTKPLIGVLLIAIGFVGVLTLAFDFTSWKTDGYITGFAFCLALIGCGASLFIADRAGYHLGWMSLLGAMLLAAALVALAVECEDYFLGIPEDPSRGLFLVIGIGFFGALFLHLGHRRHLSRAGK